MKTHGSSSARQAAQEAAGVGGGARDDDLQAGDVGEPGLEHLGVLGPDLETAADGRAQDHGDRGPAPGHVAELGRVVGQLVETEAEEVHEHDLGHRPQTAEGGPDGRPHDGLLGDGGVADAVGAVLGREALGHPEDAAAGIGDVLTEEDDAVVGTRGPRRGPG